MNPATIGAHDWFLQSIVIEARYAGRVDAEMPFANGVGSAPFNLIVQVRVYWRESA
jgi:hypothetical protein